MFCSLRIRIWVAEKSRILWIRLSNTEDIYIRVKTYFERNENYKKKKKVIFVQNQGGFDILKTGSGIRCKIVWIRNTGLNFTWLLGECGSPVTGASTQSRARWPSLRYNGANMHIYNYFTEQLKGEFTITRVSMM